MTKQVLVLGMHRSGTSMVSRLLNLMGFYYSDEKNTVLPSRNNPKGYWERRDVMELNDLILLNHKTSWDRPFQFGNKEPTLKDFQFKINNIIYKLDAHRPWFIKDPRLCITYPYWVNFLEDYLNVLVIRSPRAVAMSLYKRNNFKVEYSFALWDFYYSHLIEYLDNTKTIMVNYEDFIKILISLLRIYFPF